MPSVGNLRGSALALALAIAGCASEPGASGSAETMSSGAVTVGTAGAGRGAAASSARAGANGTSLQAIAGGRGGAGAQADVAGARASAGTTALVGAAAAGRGAAGTPGTAADADSGGASAAAGGGGAHAPADAGAAGHDNAGRGGALAADSGSERATTDVTPVLRIPLRVHTSLSELSEAELGPILQEMNAIWLEQAGICFEIEVTASEDNREDGFDFRYTAGQIPIARGSNGVYQNPHTIWSIDHPRLNDVAMPVTYPAARTTAHELGHALGLAHENPPPSNDCSRPCHCVELGDDCDEYLMRSGTKGFYLSKPELDTARDRAPRFALPDRGSAQCGEPVFRP